MTLYLLFPELVTLVMSAISLVLFQRAVTCREAEASSSLAEVVHHQ